MNPNIFREYDIRGIVDKDFPNHVIISLGRAFGTYLINILILFFLNYFFIVLVVFLFLNLLNNSYFFKS